MKITIDVSGGSAAQRALAALQARATDLAPVFRGVADDAVAESQLGFRGSMDPYGVPWKPLAPATLEGRARRAAGGKPIKRDGTLKVKALRAMASAKPLLDTGRLRNSLTRDAGPSEASVGTNAVYARIHQFGGQAGRGRKVLIPARPFFPQPERGLPVPLAESIRDRLVRHFSVPGATTSGGA